MTIDLIASSLEFLLCIPFGMYFWYRHRGSRLTRWLALIVIMLGLNGLQIFLELTLPPPVAAAAGRIAIGTDAPWWLGPAWIGVSLLNVLINSFFHYAILIVALLYNGHFNRRLVLVLAVPMAATFLFGIDVRVNDLNYRMIAAWGSVYWLASAGLFVGAVLKEQLSGHDEGVIRSSIVAALLMPPSLVLLIHQLQSGEGPMMVYIFASCLISLGIFIFLYIRGTLTAIRRELLGRAQRLEAAFMEHALKNSIAKIRMHAINIRQGLAAGEYRRVEQYVDRLLTTTDQMLSATKSISRTGGAGLVVQGDWYDLQSLIDQAVEPLRSLPDVRVVREDRPCQLYLDPRLVTECLTNILNNSMEAIDGRGTVTVSLRETRRHAILSIRDDGPGLDPWATAYVFQPFYSSRTTAAPSRPVAAGNYGLGMAHVQAVMKAHRGRVDLQSEPGEGVVVQLRFPKGDWQGGWA